MNPLDVKQFYEKFSFLTFSDVEEVLSKVKVQKLKKGDFFVRGEEKNNNIAFVKEGLLRYYFIKNSGEEINVFFRQEGTVVAAYQSIFNSSSSSLFIEALEPCTLLSIDFFELEKLYETNKNLEKASRKLLQNTLLETLERVEALIINNPEARYLHILKTNPDLYQRIPDKYIASYLGVTPVSLSRIRKRLNSNNN